MKHARFFLTLVFMFSALYHLYHAFFPAIPDDEAGKRHLAFLLVNMAGTGLLILDSPKLLLFFLPFMVQQIYTQGTTVLQSWKVYGVMDWYGLLILSTLPVLGLYIVRRNKQGTTEREKRPKQRSLREKKWP